MSEHTSTVGTGFASRLQQLPQGYRNLILVVFLVVIAVLSLSPAEIPLDDSEASLFRWVPSPVQNFMHLVVYGLLAALIMFSQRARRPAPAWIAAMGYGIVLELLQFWVPGRYPSVMDIGLNALGAALAVPLYALVFPARPASV
jgi:VanZ family protein